MTHEQELEGYILQGMARAIWVQAFILGATEIDLHVDKDTWEEEAGETPPAAMQSARELARGIAMLNAESASTMFLALRGHIRPRHRETRATEADRAYAFGEDVALACLGTLDVPEFARYNLPQMKTKIELDNRQKMELSWDISGEREAAVQNPPGENMWAVLVDGDRKWEHGGTPDDALENARRRWGSRWPISIELGADGRPIRGTRGPEDIPGPAAHWAADRHHRNPSGRWAHSDVQSLLFDKGRYTTKQAQRWAQDHGFRYGAVDEGRGEYIHLRQFDPIPGRPCATVDFGHQGIKARVCSTRNPISQARR